MEKTVKKININIIAALLGGIAFVLIYGVKILNPLYTDWLLTGGDPSQHYLGWEFFRRSDWYFPLGLTDQLAYPLKTSVIYTDSIPIFAVFLNCSEVYCPSNFSILAFGDCYALSYRDIMQRRFWVNVVLPRQ